MLGSPPNSTTSRESIHLIQCSLKCFAFRDIFSALGIYRNNEWGFRPTIYTSQCLVSEGRSRVETVGTGEWFYNSTKGLQRPEMAERPRQPTAFEVKKEKGESLAQLPSPKEPKIVKEPEEADQEKEVRRFGEEMKERGSEQTRRQLAEEVIKPMSMMMIKGGQGSSTTAAALCKKTASPAKKSQGGMVVKKIDVEKSSKESGKVSVKIPELKIEEKKTPVKEKKKALPAWMEKIERQLGLMSLDELANI